MPLHFYQAVYERVGQKSGFYELLHLRMRERLDEIRAGFDHRESCLAHEAAQTIEIESMISLHADVRGRFLILIIDQA